MTQNFVTNFPDKYLSFRFTLSIIPFSSYCMYEMPTGEFNVISRETHPPPHHIGQRTILPVLKG